LEFKKSQPAELKGAFLQALPPKQLAASVRFAA
jgi:hypothetical protein